MPVAEKLRLMEALWESLSSRTDGSFVSPPWHELALKQAEEDLGTGAARFVDLAEAKEQLRGRDG
ncbi:MAG: acyl-protein synthetase [Betaproteobacteria bacterium]|nr:acyl-protein synthetase [Betaproteobacteria bacterium]